MSNGSQRKCTLKQCCSRCRIHSSTRVSTKCSREKKRRPKLQQLQRQPGSMRLGEEGSRISEEFFHSERGWLTGGIGSSGYSEYAASDRWTNGSIKRSGSWISGGQDCRICRSWSRCSDSRKWSRSRSDSSRDTNSSCSRQGIGYSLFNSSIAQIWNRLTSVEYRCSARYKRRSDWSASGW